MHEICIYMGVCYTYYLSWNYTTLWYTIGTCMEEETTAGQLATPHVSECVGHVCWLIVPWILLSLTQSSFFYIWRSAFSDYNGKFSPWLTQKGEIWGVLYEFKVMFVDSSLLEYWRHWHIMKTGPTCSKKYFLYIYFTHFCVVAMEYCIILDLD